MPSVPPWLKERTQDLNPPSQLIISQPEIFTDNKYFIFQVVPELVSDLEVIPDWWGYFIAFEVAVAESQVGIKRIFECRQTAYLCVTTFLEGKHSPFHMLRGGDKCNRFA